MSLLWLGLAPTTTPEHACRLVLRSMPTDATGMIQSLLSVGKFDQAQTGVDAFRNACPDTPDAANLQGMLLLKRQQFDQARNAFQQALQLNPVDFPALYGLASVDLQLERRQECRQTINRHHQLARTSNQASLVDRISSQLDALRARP